MSKASSGFGKIIAWLLVVVLIIAAVGVALYFALRSQGITYYVEYGGERYFANSDGGGLALYTEDKQSFSVKSLTGGEIEFDVKITSNADNNIRFVYGDEFHYSYAGVPETDDYSDVFGLQADTDGFSVIIPQNMTVEQAIETKYGGDITLMNELSDNLAYFVIVVTVSESSVKLPFIFVDKVSGVTLDPPQIIF